MAEATAPVLLVVGGDIKRLQWLTHHVTSHWPNAQVTTAPAEDSVSLAAFVQETDRVTFGIVGKAIRELEGMN